MAATLNGFRVVSVRIVARWRGAWMADVDVDPDDVSLLPSSGPATLVLGTAPATTTTVLAQIDPLASGSMVATKRVRIVGGLGWSSDVPAQDFSQASGVLSTDVYTATATAVTEKVTDLSPTTLGLHYARSAGPASRVLEGVDWWVDPATGTTFVGTRPVPVADPSLEVLDWDPLRKLLTVSCDALVVPGTVITDARIGDSPVTIRDVEQTFDSATGARALCWCSVNPTSPLLDAFRRIVQEFGRTDYLPSRKYTVVEASGGSNQWALQAADRDATGAASPLPDLIPVTAWGAPGVTATLAPSTPVLVVLVDADPGQPVMVAYSPDSIPLILKLDAQTEVDVGPSAAAVKLAGGSAPVALSTLVATELGKIATSIGQIATYINGIAPGTVTPYTPGSTAASKTTAT